jgi:hypothetical protein
MASLQPTFLWRRNWDENPDSSGFDACLRWNPGKTRATQAAYATIIVNPAAQSPSRATSPHRQNLLDVALLTSDCQSETVHYNCRAQNCQAAKESRTEPSAVAPDPLRNADSGTANSLYKLSGAIALGSVVASQTADLTKCQIPHPIPPSNKRRKTIAAKTINLNFRYRLLSAGASEPCGKYGGGV